jgi:hypothetical protein
MKMENGEGSEIFGNESTKNESSLSSGVGEISELSSTEERTSACLNIAQDIAQDSGALTQILPRPYR